MSPELHARLLDETPRAPAELRERVAAITAAPAPARPSRMRFLGRRAALAVAAATALSALGAGILGAIEGSGGETESTATPALAERARPPQQPLAGRPSLAPDQVAAERAALPATPPESARAADQAAGGTPGPNTGRAQDYNASLRLLVADADDLSAATQRALRATRSFGGYAVSVQYGTPEAGEGSAELLVRVPVTRVQAAIVEFSELGRILAQDVRISDLQQPLDELTRSIRRLERRSAQIRARLASPRLTEAERVRLQNELASIRAAIDRHRRDRTEINRRASLASVSLALTTREPEEPVAAPGRLRRAIDDAVGVLKAELALVAYALIVASPFLLLLGAALLGRGAYRRHADQRLLERA